jgi:hypothetical protein
MLVSEFVDVAAAVGRNAGTDLQRGAPISQLPGQSQDPT